MRTSTLSAKPSVADLSKAVSESSMGVYSATEQRKFASPMIDAAIWGRHGSASRPLIVAEWSSHLMMRLGERLVADGIGHAEAAPE
jgi:hypothetical protein